MKSQLEQTKHRFYGGLGLNEFLSPRANRVISQGTIQDGQEVVPIENGVIQVPNPRLPIQQRRELPHVAFQECPLEGKKLGLTESIDRSRTDR